MKNNKKIILKPLSPREGCEDQMKLKEKRVQEKREMSETPIQSKSETPKKRETHERKMSGLLKVNEVKKLLTILTKLICFLVLILFCRSSKLKLKN